MHSPPPSLRVRIEIPFVVEIPQAKSLDIAEPDIHSHICFASRVSLLCVSHFIFRARCCSVLVCDTCCVLCPSLGMVELSDIPAFEEGVALAPDKDQLEATLPVFEDQDDPALVQSVARVCSSRG